MNNLLKNEAQCVNHDVKFDRFIHDRRHLNTNDIIEGNFEMDSLKVMDMERTDGSGSEASHECTDYKLKSTDTDGLMDLARIRASWLKTGKMESFESNKEFIGSECGSLQSQTSRPFLSDDEDILSEYPSGERWPPLGAPDDDIDCQSICSFDELSRYL